MRTATILIGITASLFLAALSSCGAEEPPADTTSAADTGVKDTTADSETPEEAGEEAETPDDNEDEGDGETEEQAQEESEPVDTGPLPFDRIWPEHTMARKILPDPHDESLVYSYWRNAKVGDWVAFLTWEQKIALYTVVEREGDKLKYEFRNFELNGNEVPLDEADIRDADISKDDVDMRGSLLNNPLVVRSVYEWKLFDTDKTLYCERRFVDNPQGQDNETLYCWDIRCGGYVFQRRGKNLVVLMIDYGNAENPPDWSKFKPQDLITYWYKYDRFLDEPFVSQEDPPEGEMPESPVETAPPTLAEKLLEFEKLIEKDIKEALKEKNFSGAGELLGKTGEAFEAVRKYALANNYKPAVKTVEAMKKKVEEFESVLSEENIEKASKAYEELQDYALRLFKSVNYTPEKSEG